MTTQPHDAETGAAEADPIEVDWSWTASDDDDWVPPEIDTTKPSTARMYDYALGGKDNYAIDRQAVGQVAELLPDLKSVALANRGFLIRAVEALGRLGIDQFVDLGSGIPTSPNVHEVAAPIQPAVKVVYVDNDPVVMTYNRALRESRPGVMALNHDMRAPNAIFENQALRKHLDLERPIGLLLVAVLHFVRRETAIKVVQQYRRLLPPGSYLAISAICSDGMDPALVERLESVYETSSSPLIVRTTAQMEQLFEGTRLIEPGLVDATQWRNDGNPLPIRILSGVGQVL